MRSLLTLSTRWLCLRPLVSFHQFVRLICDGIIEDSNSGDVLGDIETIDEACGAGASDVELTPAYYATIIADAVSLLNDDRNLAIPADELDTYCQVRAGGEHNQLGEN